MRWIVVGAGPGGCVAARRLHDAGAAVVVVEAGPALRPGAVPAAIDGADSFAALAEPGRGYDHLVATRTAASGSHHYPRGRGVGGSSAVNAMVALRGDRTLYESWGWDDTDAAFERVLVPVERPAADELGRIDRLLLAGDERARIAPLTRRARRRVTAAEAYLWPILESPTLTMLTDRTVDVVTFDGSQTVTGVRLADGTHVGGDAVVVAAGAVHTPAVLQRSEVVAPGVGAGLQDHPAAAFLLRLRSADATETTAGNRGLATASFVDADPVQILALNHLGPSSPPDTAMLLVALMRPVGASGTVRIRSDDPMVHPAVDFDLLRDRADLRELRRGVESVLDLLARPPLADVVDEVFIDDQGTTGATLDDADAIDRWLRLRGADYVHASSSCAQAVVSTGGSSDGRVRGHDGLYVCDASAFPSIPNVNTVVPTMMLAERFSERWVRRAADGRWSG